MIADIDLPVLPPPSVPSERSVSVVVTLSPQSPHHHRHSILAESTITGYESSGIIAKTTRRSICQIYWNCAVEKSHKGIQKGVQNSSESLIRLFESQSQ